LNAVFYTKDFNKKITKPVSVVLSPQFYWIKKIDIPIKSLFQAKKIAKNIFDLEADRYIFGAFRAGGEFFAYAVERDLNLKIERKYIKAVYLAQTELYGYECISVDDNYCIKKVNGVLFCFPKEEGDKCENVDEILKTVKFSGNKITLDTVNIDKSALVLMALVFVLFNAIYGIKTFMYKRQISLNQTVIGEYASKYGLPVTSYQLRSIKETLAETDKKQKQIRKDLEFFSATPLGADDVYRKLLFDSHNYELVINTGKNFNGYFSKRFKLLNSYLKNGQYYAKLAHE
jgi:hypothetical protein